MKKCESLVVILKFNKKNKLKLFLIANNKKAIL